MSTPEPTKPGGLKIWLQAAAVLVVIVVGGLIAKSQIGTNPKPRRDDLIKQLNQKYALTVTQDDAQCMIDAGYGNAADLSGLSCLHGEQRRALADLLWRTLAPVPASQQAVDCFTQWALRDDVATQLAAIGKSGLSVVKARAAAVDMIGRDGVRPCATA